MVFTMHRIELYSFWATTKSLFIPVRALGSLLTLLMDHKNNILLNVPSSVFCRMQKGSLHRLSTIKIQLSPGLFLKLGSQDVIYIILFIYLFIYLFI